LVWIPSFTFAFLKWTEKELRVWRGVGGIQLLKNKKCQKEESAKGEALSQNEPDVHTIILSFESYFTV